MEMNKAMSKVLFGRAVVDKDAKGIVKSTNDFANYTPQDFMRYWKAKASERGIKYIPVKYKDTAILKSVCKNFSNAEVKNMIDYIWDEKSVFFISGEKLHTTSYGLFLLSNGFLNRIYNDSIKWAEGTSEKEGRGWEAKEEDVQIDF